MTTDLDVVWHNDGHRVELTIDRHLVKVTPVECPNLDDHKRACSAPDAPCVVDYFVQLYGLECNQGQAPAEHVMQIAWALLGDRRDLDACQLWFIPLADEAFGSWLEDIDA